MLTGCTSLTQNGDPPPWSHQQHVLIYVHTHSHKIRRGLRCFRKKKTTCPLGRLSLSCVLNQPPAASGLNLTPLALPSSSQAVSNAYLQLLNVPQKDFKAVLKMLQTGFCTYSHNFVCKVLHCVHAHVCVQSVCRSKGSTTFGHCSFCNHFKYEYYLHNCGLPTYL